MQCVRKNKYIIRPLEGKIALLTVVLMIFCLPLMPIPSDMCKYGAEFRGNRVRNLKKRRRISRQ